MNAPRVALVVASLRLMGRRRLGRTLATDVMTRAATVIEARASVDQLVVTSRPPLAIDPVYPLAPMAIRGARWAFGLAKLEMDVAREPARWRVDVAAPLREACETLIERALKGTPAGAPGFSPFSSDARTTVLAIAQRFRGRAGDTQRWLTQLGAGDFELRVELVCDGGLEAGRVRVAAGERLVIEARAGLLALMAAPVLREVVVSGPLDVIDGDGAAVRVSRVLVRGAEVVAAAGLPKEGGDGLGAPLGEALSLILAAHPRVLGVDLAAWLGRRG